MRNDETHATSTMILRLHTTTTSLLEALATLLLLVSCDERSVMAYVISDSYFGNQHRPRDKLPVRSRFVVVWNSVASWEELESKLQPAIQQSPPLSIDSALDASKPNFSSTHPTLIRERHGWCPYSERVWLTLELLNDNKGSMSYDTVRIDNTGGPRPSYFSGQTPQLKWPESSRWQGESMDLVSQLDERYNNFGLLSNDANVQDIIGQFKNIFPRGARPSSRAAFLFQNNGEPLWKATFEETLQKTNSLLEKSNNGPFFHGKELTAADIAWAPFLERYRYQLPCLHQGFEPDDARAYPHLAAWYRAMDKVPAYACRVKGDASSWRKVLTMAGFGNAGVPPQINRNMEELVEREAAEAMQYFDNKNEMDSTWQAYAATRPYVASSPQAEAAMTILRNRRAILNDFVKRAPAWSSSSSGNGSSSDAGQALLPQTIEQVDETLRELVDVLLENDGDLLTNNRRLAVGALAAFLDERMCVPRDMGAMSAACIKRLAWNLQTYN